MKGLIRYLSLDVIMFMSLNVKLYVLQLSTPVIFIELVLG